MWFYSVFVCCLLMAQININLAKNIATTDNPSTDEDGDRLLNVQTKLLKIQDEIISITAEMGIAETLDFVSDKVAATERHFESFKEDLSKELMKQTMSGCSLNAKKMLNNQYVAVAFQLKNLKSSLKAYQEKRLPSDTIEDIKALRFELAEQKLKQMKNFEDVSKIIRAVYTNCSDNFDVLANLIESLKDIRIIDFSVRALQQEMAKNDQQRSPFKWIRLAQILKTGLINQSKAEFAHGTEDELKHSIRDFTLEALNASVSRGKFERNGEMDNLTTAIYLLDPLQSESIIEEFVATNYGQVSAKKILETILSHRFIQQRAKGISVLFWEIKNAENLNSDVVIKIASALHKLRLDKEFENLTKAQQDEVDKIIENLPVCARNLFFLPSVCFWNKAKEEYLTAGNMSSNYDNSRRNVFSTDPLPESQWKVNTTGDGENFLFSSRTYAEEYLYAAAFDFNEDLRYVFNWIPGKNLDKQSEWSIELDDDYCFIKSAMYNEYLFSSNIKRPDTNNLRYVFTWVPGHSIREPKFQWQIRKCN
ncbi:uncharacterized protein LOC129939992 [Eupeodes corollae]|uniref:uncharacterized protein LOC129939992 n=1 Tax=Eupeodes corollae TaxID=290404 RepID=UPI0024914E54|nr:uncharacterized protein LOC129939992 [Eupeodes corollae]